METFVLSHDQYILVRYILPQNNNNAHILDIYYVTLIHSFLDSLLEVNMNTGRPAAVHLHGGVLSLASVFKQVVK